MSIFAILLLFWWFLSWIPLVPFLSQSTALWLLLLCSTLVYYFHLFGNSMILSFTLLQLYILQVSLSWYCISNMVLNPHSLWHSLPIMVFAIQNSVLLQQQLQCIGKNIVLFHWLKSNLTVKLLFILNNRNCILVFKDRIVKLQNQIEEREHSYCRDGAHLFPK